MLETNGTSNQDDRPVIKIRKCDITVSQLEIFLTFSDLTSEAYN